MKRREARWRQSEEPIRKKKTKPVKNTYRDYWQRRKKRKRDKRKELRLLGVEPLRPQAPGWESA